MRKELRELLAQLETMKGEVRSMLGENKVTEAEAKMAEVRSLQKKVEIQQALDDEEGREKRDGRPAGERRDEQELETQYRSVFLKGIRRQRISTEERSTIAEYAKRAVMHEGGASGEDDGDSALIVPTDVSTQINTILRSLNDLSQYVRVETVNTLSGSRVLEKDDDMVALAAVDEYGEIGESANPKFVKVSYALAKRAGILPLTNELLKDSDQNVLAYVTDWIAKKVVVTRNTLITTLMATLNAAALADPDAIKHALNVSLDPAISASSVVLTNQDGFHWLDTQKDGNGRYLLQDDITQPGRKLLFGRPVAVSANRYLASVVGPPAKAPLILGNLKQLAVLFTRGRYELMSTREGGDAFKRDTTDLRVISRDDCKTWDSAAAVYGQLDIS